MPLTSARAVLFDAGNTLVSLDYAFIAEVVSASGAVEGSLEPAAVSVADRRATHELDRLVLAGALGADEELVPRYFERILAGIGVAEAARPGIIERMQERHRAENLWSVVLAGARELLDELARRGYKLAVVSNSDGTLVELLDRVGLLRPFDAVLDSTVVGAAKPDAHIFKIALDRLGIGPAEAVHVGDFVAFDVLGARRAGIPAVLLDPLNLYADLDCMRVRCLHELLDLLPPTAPGSGLRA